LRGDVADAAGAGNVGAMPSPFTEVEAGGRAVKLTNPDRPYFPGLGITKLGLAEYYLAVGEGITRALAERPTTLKRFPEGIDGEAVYQKRLPHGAPPWVETARVTFPSGRTAEQLCVTELASVIWAVQMSTVEFHPWHCHRSDPDAPDELRIDLDPQPGTGFAEVVRAAQLTREILAELGIAGWPKTSGSRGLHIAIRIAPRWDFIAVRRAALALAREIERRDPGLVTTAWWKEERGERVFVDFNQNARDRTMASAYSVRALPEATVSAPVTWDELPDCEIADFTIRSMPGRFAELGDVYAGYAEAEPASIDPLLEWSARDERDHGQGDAPYPPNYPKMPGEPMRVQPSKARQPDAGQA
jgi:DNA ligase D